MKILAHSTTNMSQVRRSLRQLNIPPEEELDWCFICLEDILTNEILACKRQTCCERYLHKSCYRRLRNETRMCGNCCAIPSRTRCSRVVGHRRRGGSLTLEELTLRARRSDSITAINLFLISRRASIIHTRSNLSWRAFPYISSEVFNEFLERMKSFILTQRDHNSPFHGIYMHANVIGQLFWVYNYRIAIYKIFERMIPSALELCLSFIKYQFIFVTDPNQIGENDVSVQEIQITRNHSITPYPEDTPYTGSVVERNIFQALQETNRSLFTNSRRSRLIPTPVLLSFGATSLRASFYTDDGRARDTRGEPLIIPAPHTVIGQENNPFDMEDDDDVSDLRANSPSPAEDSDRSPQTTPTNTPPRAVHLQQHQQSQSQSHHHRLRLSVHPQQHQAMQTTSLILPQVALTLVLNTVTVKNG